MAIRKMPFADADRKCSGRPVRDGRRLCCFHLSHFRGLSVPGGGFVAFTCHGFLAFLCQVAALLFPPVTVSWHFRGRWAFSTSHLSQFRGISVPGGDFAASTCHTFAAFLCQVAMSAATHDAGEIKFCEKNIRKNLERKKKSVSLQPVSEITDETIGEETEIRSLFLLRAKRERMTFRSYLPVMRK